MKFSVGESEEIPLGDLDDMFFRDSLDYWQAQKKNHFAPSWENFDLMALPPEIIPFVTVVDVINRAADFVYRFWGTGHVNAKGMERTGASVSDHPQDRGPELFSEYKLVFEEQRPIAFARRLVLPVGKLPLNQISFRMPLTQDGKNVDKIISVSDWYRHKEYWEESSNNLNALGNKF